MVKKTMTEEFKEVNDGKAILLTDKPVDVNPMFSCGQYVDQEDFLNEQRRSIAKRKKIVNGLIWTSIAIATCVVYYFF